MTYRSHLKRIEKNNLESEQNNVELGKGCFGTCVKMKYRNIPVAVKRFKPTVTAEEVQCEASVVNRLDNPGTVTHLA